MPDRPDIAGNLATVRRRIEAACARAGRSAGSVRLVAVTKTLDARTVRTAFLAGQVDFGENYAQELVSKRAALEDLDASLRWHFIGHLQRNKARLVAGHVHLVHSVDDIALARELGLRAARIGNLQDVLLQVHLGGESTKHGALERDVVPTGLAMMQLEGVRLRGLMTIPPPVEDPEHSRPHYARLRELVAALRGAAMARDAGAAQQIDVLSMGMTDDFEVAIEEGATHVRVGRAIFGDRG